MCDPGTVSDSPKTHCKVSVFPAQGQRRARPALPAGPLRTVICSSPSGGASVARMSLALRPIPHLCTHLCTGLLLGEEGAWCGGAWCRARRGAGWVTESPGLNSDPGSETRHEPHSWPLPSAGPQSQDTALAGDTSFPLTHHLHFQFHHSILKSRILILMKFRLFVS